MEISYVSTDKLLSLVRQHGSIGRIERKWSFVQRSEGGVALTPTVGPRYLYRGQTRRYSPCLPSISRQVKGPGRRLADLSRIEAMGIVVNLIRAAWYCSELDKHPVFEWADTQQVHIPRMEFAQHYEVPTALVDVTESLEVALFFATHEFRDGEPHPCNDGTGILYRIDWANAPLPISNRFHPIAIQPFPRPFRQWAWSCELRLGESFEACPGLVAVEFAQDEEFAHEIRTLAEGKGALFPPDPMAEVAAKAKGATVFPREIARDVLRDISTDPDGLPTETLDDLRRSLESIGFQLSDSAAPLLTEPELVQLRSAWHAEKASWEKAIAEGFELLLIRRRRDSTKQSSP